jgi:hypothetical protein
MLSLKCIACAEPTAQIPFAQFRIRIWPASATVQWHGKAPPAMNEVLHGTPGNRYVPAKVSVSIHTDSESVSNETDESDLQYEQYDEQMI